MTSRPATAPRQRHQPRACRLRRLRHHPAILDVPGGHRRRDEPAPRVIDGQATTRGILDLTLATDHNVAGGAPRRPLRHRAPGTARQHRRALATELSRATIATVRQAQSTAHTIGRHEFTRQAQTTRPEQKILGDLKLFEPTAIHFLVAGRDGWWAAMRICQLLQRRRSL